LPQKKISDILIDMVENLIWRVISSILGIFLAVKFVSGVKITTNGSAIFGIVLSQDWQVIVLVGTVLGLINFFIKPILDKITWPLKLLTLGGFSLILNMAILWFLDVLFLEFQILGMVALFWTTVICWVINFILTLRK
jgi:putative membrane protein